MRTKQHGIAVSQRPLIQDNCEFQSGTLPLGMYVTEEAVKEPLQLHPPIPDDDEGEEVEEEKQPPGNSESDEELDQDSHSEADTGNENRPDIQQLEISSSELDTSGSSDSESAQESPRVVDT